MSLVFLKSYDGKQQMNLVNTKCDPKSIAHITLLITTIRELLINVGMVIWTFRIISNNADTDCYRVSLQKHVGDWDAFVGKWLDTR